MKKQIYILKNRGKGNLNNIDNNDLYLLVDQSNNTNILKLGEFTIYKKPGNVSENLQTGDVIQGFFTETKFVMAMYNFGDINDIANYTMLNEIDF
jgi:hypothetical protein